MVKKFRMLSIVCVFVVVTVLVFSVGCNDQMDEISADLGQEVELKIGETVSIENEEITFKFVEVSGDSRCPTGATCVWEGEVTCILEITYLDESNLITITQPGLTEQFLTDVFQEYEINFNIEPYPELDEEIKADEYRLQIMIEKTP